MKYHFLTLSILLAAVALVGCAGTTPDDGPGGIDAPAGSGGNKLYEAQNKVIRQLGY